MQVRVNEVIYEIKLGTKVNELKSAIKPKADVVILNGFKIDDDRALKNQDEIIFILKGEIPKEEDFEGMMMARHTPSVFRKLKGKRVGIAGLGGLGSNVALLLARSGVGKLLLVDFDLVEPSNLNRQAYLIKHLGMNKTEALKSLIREVNPYVKVETKTSYITADNTKTIFDGVDILVEALDNPKSKAELANAALTKIQDICVVAGSGMAGFYSSNSIITQQKTKRLYVVGDEENEAKEGCGLMAPRVNVAAAHQANMVLRILLGEVNA